MVQLTEAGGTESSGEGRYHGLISTLTGAVRHCIAVELIDTLVR